MLESPVPPRVAASVPIHVGVKNWVSPDDVMMSPMLVSLDVARVWVAPVCATEYCAPSAVMPLPVAPASTPQLNFPVVTSHNNLLDEPEHETSPAPVTPLLICKLVVVAPLRFGNSA